MFCKLCRSETTYKFSLPLVNNIQGDYFECKNCQMLQSYHLDSMSPEGMADFYELDSELSLDCGSAWRQYCIMNRVEHLVRLKIVPDLSGNHKMLDFGCGSGFVVSALRSEFKWNTFGYEPYAEATFSSDRVFQNWEAVVQNGSYSLIIASEVFEHFTNPEQQIIKIRDVLAREYAFVYITTGLYVPDKRGKDWNYLVPQSGQHVAFYSHKTMRKVRELLGATSIYQVGAEYEWLFVRLPSSASQLARARFSATAAFLRAAVGLGILKKIL